LIETYETEISEKQIQLEELAKDNGELEERIDDYNN